VVAALVELTEIDLGELWVFFASGVSR